MKILITSKHTSDGRIYLILNKKKYIYIQIKNTRHDAIINFFDCW